MRNHLGISVYVVGFDTSVIKEMCFFFCLFVFSVFLDGFQKMICDLTVQSIEGFHQRMMLQNAGGFKFQSTLLG